MELRIQADGLEEIEFVEGSHIFVEKKGHYSAFLDQEDCPGDISALVEEILLKTQQLSDVLVDHINHRVKCTHGQTAWSGLPVKPHVENIGVLG